MNKSSEIRKWDKSTENKKIHNPADRKKFTNQKFKKKFGSLQEGHGLAYLQKGAVKRKYLQEKKKEERKDTTIGDKGESTENVASDDPYATLHYDQEVFDSLPIKKPKLSKLRRAKLEYENQIKEREQQKEEREAKEKEIEAKRQKYREKKLHRYKKLNQKTRKGQPVMRSRMELLLESVEAALASEKNE